MATKGLLLMAAGAKTGAVREGAFTWQVGGASVTTVTEPWRTMCNRRPVGVTEVVVVVASGVAEGGGANEEEAETTVGFTGEGGACPAGSQENKLRLAMLYKVEIVLYSRLGLPMMYKVEIEIVLYIIYFIA